MIAVVVYRIFRCLFFNYFNTLTIAMTVTKEELTLVSEDLYTLLVKKTEGEAAVRIRGREIGSGTEAYITLYKWFMGASGLAITGRIRKLMTPWTPKAEHDIADAIE